MSMSLRKVLPLMICAMIGFVVLGSKPAYAQTYTLTGSVAQDGQYFLCNLSGYWTDSGYPYDIEVSIDGVAGGEIIYIPSVVGQAYATVDNVDVGWDVPPSTIMDPVFGPITSGTHTAVMQVFTVDPDWLYGPTDGVVFSCTSGPCTF